MYEKIRSYIDGLFSSVESSREVQELHDEILQNTYDRYGEELAAGKSEQEAYNAAIEAIGDTKELLAPYGAKASSHPGLRAAAIALYVMSIVPVVVFGVLPVLPDCVGVGIMFFMAAVATVMMVLSMDGKITGARIMRSLGVGLFVLAIIPLIVLEEMVQQSWGEALGLGLMFTFAALGTLLLVLGAAKDAALRKQASQSQEISLSPKTTAAISTGERMVNIIVWCVAGLAFFALCALSHWKYAWLVFPFAGGVSMAIRSAIRLVTGKAGGFELAVRAAILLSATSLYWDFVQETQKWILGLLIFAIAGCVEGVASGIFTLARGGKAE